MSEKGETGAGGTLGPPGTAVTILLSGILKVKLPESKQNLMRSPWRERYCVLEEDPMKRSLELKIFKANAAKSAPKLYLTLSLASDSNNVSVWKDSNTKSAMFHVRQSQEIGFVCSSAEECDQWVNTLHDRVRQLISLSNASPLTAPHIASRDEAKERKEEEARDDVSSVSDSIQSQPARISQTSQRSQGVVGGNIEPSRIEQTRSNSLLPHDSPAQFPIEPTERSPSLNRISSKFADHFDTPLMTSPPMGSRTAHHGPTPFWLGLDSSGPNPSGDGPSGTIAASPFIRNSSPTDRKASRLQTSPVRREIDPLARMRLEISELIELNNSLNERIEVLTEEKQTMAKEFQAERNLFQQRVDDLKTRNLLTNEECRTLREELHRVKRELKDTIARQEEESLKHAAEATLPQQLETYRQLSESLTRENLKLSTEAAKLGKQISEREGHEKKSLATVKLLLEKNASLENELVILQEHLEHERRAHEEVILERDECRRKLNESTSKCKRAETELRKLQSRVHEEIQNEVSVETERMLLLEEECSRLQKEIFASRNESNEWEIECLRVTQELSGLKESLDANSPKNVAEITREMEAIAEKLRSAEESAEELRVRLSQREVEISEMTSSLDVSKSDFKEMKRSWKQQLQNAEGKINKMQSEILRLNTDLVDSERRCTNHKERVSKLEAEATIAHDTRMAERQSHYKSLSDCQLQLEATTASSLALEQSNRALQRSLLESKSQLEDLEQQHHEALKALKSEKALTRQLQDSYEMLKLDREQDLLQFEEKLRRINSVTGESKQTLIETETQLSEATAQLLHHKSSKERLTLSLQDAEEKCENIKSEVKRLQDARKQEHREREAQLSKLKKSLQESELVITNLRQELGNKTSQLEELSLALEKARRDLETQREWRKECQSLEQRLELSTEKLLILEREKMELEQRLVEESEVSRDLKETVLKLKTRSADLQNSLESSLNNNEKLERSLQVSTRTKDSLEAELQEVKQSYKDCELRLSKKCLELKGALERVAEVQLESSAKAVELQNLQMEQSSLQKSFKILEESLKSSELCVETVNYSCKTLHEEAESLTKQCEEWRSSATVLEKELHEARLEINVLKGENVNLLHNCEELKEELLSEKAAKTIAVSRLEEGARQRETERKNHEDLVANLNHQLVAAETLKQELSKELSNKAQAICEVNELYRISQSESQLSQSKLAQLQRNLVELTETSEASESTILSLRSDLLEGKNKIESMTFAVETLKAEHSQLLSVLEAHKNELEHYRAKEQEYCQRILELDSSIAEKNHEILRLQANLRTLEDQNQNFSVTIVHQERSMQEKLKEATASLEDQLSAIYGRLTKTTTQHQSTTQGVRSALQRLGETHELLSQWTYNTSCNSPCPSPLLNAGCPEKISEQPLTESLELSVVKIYQGTHMLSTELAELRTLSTSLLSDNASFLTKLANLSRELPSAVRERCVKEICQLESIDTTSIEEGDPSGLRNELNKLILLQRWLRLCLEISCLFCEEMIRGESILVKEQREELLSQISNMETQQQEQLLSLQRELNSKELMNSSLVEEIQRRELATCRLMREKEEIQRVLRGKLSCSEYQTIIGSRGPTISREQLVHPSSEQEESPFEVPTFDLSSIYRAQKLTPFVCDSIEMSPEEHEVTPHLQAKRNRGASVSVNTSRKQLFPDTPHIISTGGKGRQKPSSTSAAGISNGRIIALLGKNSPH